MVADKQLFKNIKKWTQTNQDKILQQVTELVGFNTVNQAVTGTEKPCQLYLRDVFEKMGLAVDFFSPEDVANFREHEAYFPGKDYMDRPNVVGSLKGDGKGKSLIFSGHIDTGVIAPGWDSDPLTVRIEDDRLYGLGVFDMKAGLSASIMALQCLMDLGVKLGGDVAVESVVDEEFGGANGTLASRLRGYNPDAAIIPEPTNLAVYPATRGGVIWRITFRGATGMSFSGEEIVSAVHTANQFITFLEEYETERRKKAGPAPWYEEDTDLPVIVTRLEAGDINAPFCDVGPTECHVDIWIECHPGITEEQLKNELLQGFARRYGEHLLSEEHAPEFSKLIRFLPGAEVEPEFPMISLLANQVEQVVGYGSVQGAPFACDAFMFNEYSPTPAIVMGASGGNAHAPNEYINIPELFQLIEVYARTIIEWCGQAEDSNKEVFV